MITVASRTTARRAYYEKLRGISARYHVPVVDFADHDADRSFCRDPMGHLAPNGLLYYDQVLDGFFHDAIALQSELLNEFSRKKSHESCGSRPQISCPVE